MHILRFFQKSHNTPQVSLKPIVAFKPANAELLRLIADDIARAERFLDRLKKSPSNPNFCDAVCAIHSLRLARVTLEVLGGKEAR